MTPELWAALGVVGAALVTGFFGLRAAVRSARPTTQAAINAGFESLSTQHRAEIARLREELGVARTEHRAQIEEMRAEHKADLEEMREESRTEVERLGRRIDALTRREDRYRHVLGKMVTAWRDLRDLWAADGRTAPADPVDQRDLDELLDE